MSKKNLIGEDTWPKIKAWLDDWEKNPRDEDFWIKLWMWISLLAFFSGAMLSALYYSYQVNIEIDRRIDEIVEQNPALGPYLKTGYFPINVSWNNSVNVSSPGDYVAEDHTPD